MVYTVTTYDEYGEIAFRKQYKTEKSANKKFDSMRYQVTSGIVQMIVIDETKKFSVIKWGVTIEKIVTTQIKAYSNANFRRPI